MAGVFRSMLIPSSVLARQLNVSLLLDPDPVHADMRSTERAVRAGWSEYMVRFLERPDGHQEIRRLISDGEFHLERGGVTTVLKARAVPAPSLRAASLWSELLAAAAPVPDRLSDDEQSPDTEYVAPGESPDTDAARELLPSRFAGLRRPSAVQGGEILNVASARFEANASRAARAASASRLQSEGASAFVPLRQRIDAGTRSPQFVTDCVGRLADSAAMREWLGLTIRLELIVDNDSERELTSDAWSVHALRFVLGEPSASLSRATEVLRDLETSLTVLPWGAPNGGYAVAAGRPGTRPRFTNGLLEEGTRTRAERLGIPLGAATFRCFDQYAVASAIARNSEQLNAVHRALLTTQAAQSSSLQLAGPTALGAEESTERRSVEWRRTREARAQEEARHKCEADVTDTVTRGIAAYVEGLDLREPPDHEEDCSGRRFAVFVRTVRSVDGTDTFSAWDSLTAVRESIHARIGGTLHTWSGEKGVEVGAGALADEGGQGRPEKVVWDGFLFNWDGTEFDASPVAAASEPETGLTPAAEVDWQSEGDQDGLDNEGDRNLAVQSHTSRHLSVLPVDDMLDVQHALGESSTPLSLVRIAGSEDERSAQLSLGSTHRYQFLACVQYADGSTPISLQVLRQQPISPRLKQIVESLVSQAVPFERQEHIRAVPVLDVERSRAATDRSIASVSDVRRLVVRQAAKGDGTRDTRLLLPPPVPSMQLYGWYHSRDLQMAGRSSRMLSEAEAAEWALRYSCPWRATGNDGVRAVPRDLSTGASECALGCARRCHGVGVPNVYNGKLGYLPDPIAEAIAVRFSHDREGLIPVDGLGGPLVLEFRRGRYPELMPWRLVLQPRSSSARTGVLIRRDNGNQRLVVQLREGLTLFASVTPAWRPDLAHFAEVSNIAFQLLDPVPQLARAEQPSRGAERSRIALRSSRKTASAVLLSLTHSSDVPPASPVVEGVSISRRPSGTPDGPDCEVEVRVRIVVADPHNELQAGDDSSAELPDECVTGGVDLYALWDQYGETSRSPATSIEQRRTPSAATGGFVRIGGLSRAEVTAALRSGQRLSDDSNQPVPVSVLLKFPVAALGGVGAQHARYVFKVLLKSKFDSDARRDGGTGSALSGVWSNEVMSATAPLAPMRLTADLVTSSVFLSNRKPMSPRLTRIEPLAIVDRTSRSTGIVWRYNRVRLFLSRTGRQRSGGGERLGVLVGDGKSAYEVALAGFRSVIGTDALTDRGISSVSTPESYVARDDLSIGDGMEQEYLEEFRPLGGRSYEGHDDAPGIVSFLPQFESERAEWFVDLEFRIRNAQEREVHSPFVRLGLVHFQANGANFNVSSEDSLSGLARDNRLSDPVLSEWFTLLPSRRGTRPSALFGGRTLERFTLSADGASLYFDSAGNLRSQFIVRVSERLGGGTGVPVMSRLVNAECALNGVPMRHGPPLHNQGGQLHLLLAEGGWPSPRELQASVFTVTFSLEVFEGRWNRVDRERHIVTIHEVESHEPRAPRWGDSLAKLKNARSVIEMRDLRTLPPLVIDPRTLR